MNTLPLYLTVSIILFVLGLLAMMTRRNAVSVLMGIELILNSAGINFVAFSRFTAHNLEGGDLRSHRRGSGSGCGPGDFPQSLPAQGHDRSGQSQFVGRVDRRSWFHWHSIFYSRRWRLSPS